MGLHKTKKRGQARERSVGIFMMVAGVLPFFLFLFTFIYDWRTALTLPFFPLFFCDTTSFPSITKQRSESLVDYP